ncbi:RseC/MucC-like positive regulator of sigma(E) [Sinobacterium caligoides]|uniref:RseC/MucC-like positive regulator of sigma(E) n=1 Tax=Sinobacterium caligoides TaxID=933926 RepID=A0A3N2DXX6_9GAMM|nr:SoxR reducing system RseC family protein [Sinobacterium caligoides]ROS04720.1 RseC/MucC-like positive regulator of sigma(E) [Sinobacterium caligoides]
MNEEARIVGVESGELWLATQRQTSCASCAAKNGCSQKVLSELSSKDAHFIKIDNDGRHNYSVGDVVEISVAGEAIVKGSLQIYSLPLVVMIAGALLGNGIVSGDAGSISGAILGFTLGLLISKRLINNAANCRRLQPKLVAWRSGAEMSTLQVVELK